MNYSQLTSSLLYLDPPLFLHSYRILMITFWVFLIEISRLLVRHLRLPFPLALNFHSIIMTFISLLTILYTSIYFSLFGIDFSTTISKVKTILIFILLGFIVIQMTMGVVARISIFGRRYAEGKQRVKKVHKWFGYLMILWSRVIISLEFVAEYQKEEEGEGTEDADRMKAWFFVLGSVYFLLIVIEFLYRSIVPVFIKRNMRKNPKPIQQPPESQLSLYQSVSSMILQSFPTKTILSKHSNFRYIIYNNRIYQISDLIHPGGEYIISQILGQQINYYLSGGHSTYLSPKKHHHTIYVYSYFSKKYSYEIGYEEFIADKKGELEEVRWKIKIASVFGESSTALFNFYLEDRRCEVRNYYKGLNQFGKYFMLEACTESQRAIKRPYSMVLCMMEQNVSYRKLLKDLYTNRANLPFLQAISLPSHSSSLSLIIKYYPKGQLTTVIKNIPQTLYRISGPYGSGLQLPFDFSGHIIIITGGTGILPFLDLFQYLYRYLILSSLSKLFGDHQIQRLNPLKINYNMMANILIKLYASFKNQYEFYGESLLIDLYSLSKAMGRETFDMELRFSEGDYYGHGMKVKIDHIQELTMKGIVNSNPDRVYVCGTKEMEREVVDLFLDGGGREEVLYVL